MSNLLPSLQPPSLFTSLLGYTTARRGAVLPHLAQVDVYDPEDHGEGELGGVEGEEPLRGVHVGLDALLLEVQVHVR